MRIKYGKKIVWQRKDAQSMDSTLNPIIGSGIQYFKDSIMEHKANGIEFIGVPSGIIEYSDTDNYEASDEEWEEGWQKWLGILDDMIYAFVGNEPHIPDNIFNLVGDKPGEGGYISITIECTDEVAYAQYKLEDQAHKERVAQGLRYFSDYYQSLWW